jgi:hypothetical protein
MFSRRARSILALVVLACLALLVLPYSVEAQCSMCRASLAGARNAIFIRNFNIAVLVLLIPPVTMFCSIFIVLRRHKMRDDQVESSAEPKSTDV